jgi:hypothetical protein
MSVPERHVPFRISEGWPEAISGCAVTAREAGIVLGSLILSERDWASLRAGVVFTLRVDEHTETIDGLTTTHPDGTVSTREFKIPTSPVAVPSNVLTGQDFPDWVWETHGILGRLMLWDQSRQWWLVNDPDLETQIICAPPGIFAPDLDSDGPFTWLPTLTPRGHAQVAHVRRLYQLD